MRPTAKEPTAPYVRFVTLIANVGLKNAMGVVGLSRTVWLVTMVVEFKQEIELKLIGMRHFQVRYAYIKSLNLPVG